MDLRTIIYWLLAHIYPMLWHEHRLALCLEAVFEIFERPDCLAYLAGHPAARSDLEGKMSDFEAFLDFLITCKAALVMGKPLPQQTAMVCARIHSAPSLEGLAQRYVRLLHRTRDIDRLARLKAARLLRMRDAASVQLECDPIKTVRDANDALALACSVLAAVSQRCLTRYMALLETAMRALAPLPDARIRAPP